MKKLLIFLAILALGASLNGEAKPAFASPEAEATAKLTSNIVKEDRRAAKLRVYLASHNSPLTEEADHFVAEADRFNLDWKLVAAIAGVESTFGRFVPANSYNGWGWGIFTGAADGVHFQSWKDGITTVSAGLRQNYLDRGAVTIEQIGRIYAASPAWPWKVRFFLNQIEAFQPNSPKLLEITI